MAGSSGAVLFCLHGCGYTGLTWAAVAAAVKDRCHIPAVFMSPPCLQNAQPSAVASADLICLTHQCSIRPLSKLHYFMLL